MGHLIDNILAKGHVILDKLFAPEVAAYNWVHKKLFGDGGGSSVVEAVNLHELQDGEYRFVDFFAQSCPHCVDLAPKWQKASEQWKEQVMNGTVGSSAPGGKAPNVTFEAKQCLDDNWRPGAAYQECAGEQVRAFPTLKLYGPKGQEWDFSGARTPENMIQFIKQHTGLETPPAHTGGAVGTDAAAAAAGNGAEAAPPTPAEHKVPAEDSVVEYYAASCPHCVHMKPAWEDAEKTWDSTHADAAGKVKWVAKECLNDQWKPGKDFDDCLREDIQAFPTVKFESKSGKVEEYMGPRTKDGLHKFAEKQLKAVEGEPAFAQEPAKEAAPAVEAPREEVAHVENDVKPTALDEVNKDDVVKPTAPDEGKAAHTDDLAKDEYVAENDDDWEMEDDDGQAAGHPDGELSADLQAPSIKAASMGDEVVLSNISAFYQAMFAEEKKECKAVQHAAFL